MERAGVAGAAGGAEATEGAVAGTYCACQCDGSEVNQGVALLPLGVGLAGQRQAEARVPALRPRPLPAPPSPSSSMMPFD